MRTITVCSACLAFVLFLGVTLTRNVVAQSDEAVAAGGKTRLAPSATQEKEKKPKIVKTDAQWRKQLTRQQYYVTREGGTERAFTGRYWRHKAKGVYQCVCCDEPLFPSSTKYKSGTGWPSFYAPIDDERIAKSIDRKLFVARTEVKCSRCDAHLGHVFPDGPRPTGLRYCLNSAALKFEPEERSRKEKSKPR